ncbi:MAG: UPF0280 family protein [Allorhizobium sp.]
MTSPLARYLDGDRNGRLHLQHGPIDLVIGVDGASSVAAESAMRHAAFQAAFARFQTILDELMGELPLLRAAITRESPSPRGAVARRMWAATLPLGQNRFITPMAAVAGAVADEILDAMMSIFPEDGRPRRAYVNNGGDIALHLEAGAEFRIAMTREDGQSLGAFAVSAASPSRGIGTSGRGGRSLSMGVADSVTVAARSAAAADAAATLIANAVDLPGHSAISRARAIDVVDDSDLGARLVATGCGELTTGEAQRALSAGAREADDLLARGLIDRAALFLKDQALLVNNISISPISSPRYVAMGTPTEHSHHA